MGRPHKAGREGAYTEEFYAQTSRLKMELKWLKKVGSTDPVGSGGEGLRCLVDHEDESFIIRDQCELLGLNRSSYYITAPEAEANLELMRLIDRQYLETPFSEVVGCGSGCSGRGLP
ncbi:MAG: hypothetical protein V4719_10480 [Planctomycetota bacterium]